MAADVGVKATGGDYIYDKMVNGLRYRFHVFTTPGASTLNVTQGGEIEYLVVGGGGAGGEGVEEHPDNDVGVCPCGGGCHWHTVTGSGAAWGLVPGAGFSDPW